MLILVNLSDGCVLRCWSQRYFWWCKAGFACALARNQPQTTISDISFHIGIHRPQDLERRDKQQDTTKSRRTENATQPYSILRGAVVAPAGAVVGKVSAPVRAVGVGVKG